MSLVTFLSVVKPLSLCVFVFKIYMRNFNIYINTVQK